MAFSFNEKLILTMLSDIYRHLEVVGEVDPKLVKKAATSDNDWALHWEYSFLDDGGNFTNPPEVEETAQILTMWDLLEGRYEEFSPDEKEAVAQEAETWGNKVRFEGFDQNNEEQYWIAKFIIKDLKRFENFANRNLNTHAPSIERYRRMLSVYKQLWDEKCDPSLWTPSDIAGVLKAQALDYKG